MNFDLSTLPIFSAVGTRLSGVMLAAPAFSSLQIPAPVKLFVLLGLTSLLTPTLSEQAEIPQDWIAMVPILCVEFIAGFAIGLAFRWTMAGVEIVGELAGLQMGMGIASTIDPSSGNNAMFTQSIFALLYATCFLAMDGHHLVLQTLHASYGVLPIGGKINLEAIMLDLVKQTAGVLVIGLRLAAGFVLPLMMITLAMALISRAFPQANVFILSYAASLLLGLLLFATTTPALQHSVRLGIEAGVRNAYELLQGLAGP